MKHAQRRPERASGQPLPTKDGSDAERIGSRKGCMNAGGVTAIEIVHPRSTATCITALITAERSGLCPPCEAKTVWTELESRPVSTTKHVPSPSLHVLT